LRGIYKATALYDVAKNIIILHIFTVLHSLAHDMTASINMMIN